jgi:hypothetical protein
MSVLTHTRQMLDVAVSAFWRTDASTARLWNDVARRSFDERITKPMSAAVRQYATTVAVVDQVLDECLRLISD